MTSSSTCEKEVFQFTTSQGGRRVKEKVSDYDTVLSIHDLTRRSTWCDLCYILCIRPFNSRPHKEVDINISADIAVMPLSIHDLTRRSTVISRYYVMSVVFFQFTTSQGGRPLVPREVLGVGAFQFTTSQGGRRHTVSTDNQERTAFNSRPHKEVDAVAQVQYIAPLTFQFTTSQGGRPLHHKHVSSRFSFNSRPHKEVDITRTIDINLHVQTFNSRPHKEVDTNSLKCCIIIVSFNSRPHKEVDLLLILLLPHTSPFNSRPHKEVD